MTEEASPIKTNKLLIKNLPCDLDGLSSLLRSMELCPLTIESFGRKRALLAYRTVEMAQTAFSKLAETTVKSKPLNVSAFGGNGGAKKTREKEQHKETQTMAQAEAETNAAQPALISKQLGLVETICVDEENVGKTNSNTVKSKSKRTRRTQMAPQPYDYIIAMDFEATCWENQPPPRWRDSEIIEFPAVLVNMKTGKVEAEFHKYVMPIESPRLSAFCTELTGISQKTVDSGIPLQQVLMMFHEWLRNELHKRALTLPKMSKDSKPGNCAFVTWTDWDFGICLDKECRRKSIRKYPYFNQWIDLRVLFRNFYGHRPLNFSDALSHAKLPFTGRLHSGIDDAKNLAALTCKMVRDGAVLAVTKDLTPHQSNINCFS